MDDVYKLEQYHCHWGCSDSRGSEHTVDGQAFAGEVRNISNEIIISSQSVAFIRTFGTVRSANQILTTQTSAIIPMIAKAKSLLAVYQQSSHIEYDSLFAIIHGAYDIDLVREPPCTIYQHDHFTEDKPRLQSQLLVAHNTVMSDARKMALFCGYK